MSWWPFSGRTQMRDIFWLGTARQEIRTALANLNEEERAQVLQRINARLVCIFPNGCRICVTNVFRGFRSHPDQFILQVETEARNQQRSVIAPHVVKIFFGEARCELEREGQAWESFWENSEPQGMALMRVRCVRNSNGQIYALVYQEAGTSLSARQVISLERAVIDSVRHENPDLSSVRNSIDALFVNLRLLHMNSAEQPPNNQVASTFPAEPNLDRSLLLWSDFDPNHADGNTHREKVRRAGGFPGSPFIDPVDYFAYVRDMLARGITVSERQTPLVPTTRMGWAHGDLHGRNILVGVTDNERVTSPAVFDYGKMGCNQPVVFDFVKLETELKIRALPAIFQGEFEQSRNPLMQEFEHVLNRWTHHCTTNRWLGPAEIPPYWPPVYRAPGAPLPLRTPRVPVHAPALCRLLAVLLDIRQQAALVLQDRSSRPSNWFRQYLFWLAFYGLRTVRYSNLLEGELQSAFYSAGVAAAELQ